METGLHYGWRTSEAQCGREGLGAASEYCLNKQKKVRNANERSQGRFLFHGQDMGNAQHHRNCVEQWVAVGGWRRLAVGGGWRLAVGPHPHQVPLGETRSKLAINATMARTETQPSLSTQSAKTPRGAHKWTPSSLAVKRRGPSRSRRTSRTDAGAPRHTRCQQRALRRPHNRPRRPASGRSRHRGLRQRVAWAKGPFVTHWTGSTGQDGGGGGGGRDLLERGGGGSRGEGPPPRCRNEN